MGQANAVSQPCFRQDLTTSAIVFGSLLLATAAFCGTLNVSRPASPFEEAQVISDEHAIGPSGFDPYALDCENERIAQREGYQLASAGSRCAVRRTRGSSGFVSGSTIH